nr:hypothetical protein [Tanacetum cinerariifolium]
MTVIIFVGLEERMVYVRGIQVAQKKVKIVFENADSSSRIELIPSKIKYVVGSDVDYGCTFGSYVVVLYDALRRLFCIEPCWQTYLVDTDTEFETLEDLRETEISQPLLVVPSPVPSLDDLHLTVGQAHTPVTIDIEYELEEAPSEIEETARMTVRTYLVDLIPGHVSLNSKGNCLVSIFISYRERGLGLGYGALRRRELALGEGLVPSTFEIGQSSRSMTGQQRVEETPIHRSRVRATWVDPMNGIFYTDILVDVPPDRVPLQTPPSPEWSSGEDEFLEVGAQLELYGVILHGHTQRLDALPPTLFEGYDRDLREL